MKRLRISDDRKNEKIEEIRRSDESKYDHRLHGILLVPNSMSPYKVSEVMGNNPRSVKNWANSFPKYGFEGRGEPKRSERPARLSEVMDRIA